MPDAQEPNPLSFATTDDLFNELARRHNGEGRCLFVASCLPVEGKPDGGNLRTIFVSNDLRLSQFCVGAAIQYVREKLQ